MRMQRTTWLLASLMLLPATAQEKSSKELMKHVPAKDGGLGSTMTWGDQGKKPQTALGQAREEKVLVVEAVGESDPALKYRLWRPRFELQPGTAHLHFARALLMWKEQPASFRSKVVEWGPENLPDEVELKKFYDRMKNVFDELHMLATSEDFMWDHRLRDIRGPQLFMYLLPEVQSSRDLARLLSHKIRYEISQRDIDSAVQSLQDGFRLAAFVGQGETLVQQLVGIAIESILFEQVETLMQLENGPNMYWPLASLPRPLIQIRESVQFELGSIHRVFPILEQAEKDDMSDQYWSFEWAEAFQDLEALAGDGGLGPAFAVVAISAEEPAKKRLVERGYEPEFVAKLPTVRAVMLDASLEVRRISDDLAKANLLPGTLGFNIAQREDKAFQRWMNENKFQSGAAAIVGLLFPAVQAATAAGTRQEYFLNRLMTIEALRMHAAENGGQLPDTLDELGPVPALPNPFTGDNFDYRVTEDKGSKLVTLTAEVPESIKYYQQIQVRFESK